ncbi:uncharacterized protein LOC121868707 isoform X2 [Homarus americanus]|uniref:uncharacterized protein LOC121868707 isoform X2 n=1 Tax=Homarus americanus TaxID=6706 RepID=UPI001C43946C|nr:uncharacterized protein LOC121868707 isoform X2 [Homarus americanus]
MTGVRQLTVLLATYLLLPAGDVGKVEAAKRCKFNGIKYKSGEVVLELGEACITIQCQRKVSQNSKPSKHVELILLPKPLTSCTCTTTSKASTNLRSLYIPSASDPQHRDLNSVYPWWKKERKNRPWYKTKRASRKKRTKKCMYNKGKYIAGETVLNFPERCLDLICRKVTKNKSELAVQYKNNCTCSDPLDPGQEDGQCKYAKFTPDHSFCQPKNSDCGIKFGGVTNTEKKNILQVHNEFRNKVARGEEERGSPGPQPSAANMLELVWNDELAQVAQAWSNTCPTGHDCQMCRHLLDRDYVVGQNLYWSWGFNDTELVWAETQEVGCGAVYHGPCVYGILNFNFCKTYVCNYGPSGNFLGRPVYKVGPPASQCPTEVSPTYKGLCK